MLSGAVHRLAREGWTLSLLSRGARAFAHDVGETASAYPCDYHDDDGFRSALDAACQISGPIDLGVAWFHTLKISAPRDMALHVGADGRPGRLFQVLGSAVADPGRPDRLTVAAQVAGGLANCRLRQVVLGFQIVGAGARWLTHEEISSGLSQAIDRDETQVAIGQTRPWSARPS